MSDVDPLAEVVTLLQPSIRFSKLVEGAGTWRMQRTGTGEPFYAAVLEGSCRLRIGDGQPVTLVAGEFLLVPAMQGLVIESTDAPEELPATVPVEISPGHFRLGPETATISMRTRVGHCRFDSPDNALLVSLLPQVIIVREGRKAAILMQLLDEETRANRPARELVLERLLEVLLIEALRSSAEVPSAPGLARGIADERLAPSLRALHAQPGHPWTMAELANEASLSRSAFFARFNRVVGLPPMEYLLNWRMAQARQLLRARQLDISQIAQRVGYSSTSTFTAAFARQVGIPPARYSRMDPG